MTTCQTSRTIDVGASPAVHPGCHTSVPACKRQIGLRRTRPHACVAFCQARQQPDAHTSQPRLGPFQALFQEALQARFACYKIKRPKLIATLELPMEQVHSARIPRCSFQDPFSIQIQNQHFEASLDWLPAEPKKQHPTFGSDGPGLGK